MELLHQRGQLALHGEGQPLRIELDSFFLGLVQEFSNFTHIEELGAKLQTRKDQLKAAAGSTHKA